MFRKLHFFLIIFEREYFLEVTVRFSTIIAVLLKVALSTITPSQSLKKISSNAFLQHKKMMSAQYQTMLTTGRVR
jgi:hypothetical protein